MKKFVLEDNLEDLQKKSKERHKGSKKDELPKGSFDLNGKLVDYEVYLKERDRIYSKTKVGQKTFYIFLMNQLDFISLDKKEKDSVIKYRIKKYLEKKNSLVENRLSKKILRRLNHENFDQFLEPLISDINIDDCRFYKTEEKFIHNVVLRVVDDFLLDVGFEDDEEAEMYDEIHAAVFNVVKEWYTPELKEVFEENCGKSVVSESTEKISKIIGGFVKNFNHDYICEIEADRDEDGLWVLIKYKPEFEKLDLNDRLSKRINDMAKIERFINEYLKERVTLSTMTSDEC